MRIKGISKAIVLILILSLSFGTIAYADEYGGTIENTRYSGEIFNSSLNWSLDPDTGDLNIWGNGPMPDYGSGQCGPYTSCINDIYIGPLAKTLYVEEGVTHIGNYAFTGRWTSLHEVSNINLRRAYIASSVSSIGQCALNIANLQEVYILGENVTFDSRAIYSETTIYGYAGTSVEQYAKNNGNPFVAMCREHTETLVNAQEPTCTSSGYSGDLMCSVCGMTISQGHVLPSLDHDYVLVNAVSPTCTENGYSGDTVCSVCGDIKETGSTIDALGHDMGSWQLLHNPECEKEGTKIRFCNRCDYNEVESIAPIGHRYGEVNYTWADDYSSVTAERVCLNDSSHVETETVMSTAAITKPATCEEKGETTYTSASFENEAFEVQIKVVENIDPTGHDWNTPTYTWGENNSTVTAERVCKNNAEHKENETVETVVVTVEPTIAKDGSITYTATFENPAFEEQVRVISIPATGVEGAIRIAGKNRFLTSFKVADQLKETLGVEKFDNVILAYGMDYPDALGGSYLSCVLDAPILLVNSQKANITAAQDYIRANLKEGGTVYMLGGTSVVPEAAVEGLEGFKAVRLGGKNRYATNLKILEEAAKFDAAPTEVLVCTATGFADSLSAAATGKPILLVGASLNDDQKAYLAGLTGEITFTAVGGTGVVSEAVMAEFEAYGKTDRVSGKNRYITSVAVAEKYFKVPKAGVLAYGMDFPDGLCGGALAHAIGAPLILTANNSKDAAVEYAGKAGITSGMILGGAKLISDDTARVIFHLPEETEIVSQ